MNQRSIITRISALLLSVCTIGAFTGCQPDEFGAGNGLEPSTDPNFASFTVTPVAGKNNTYALRAREEGVIGLKWDKGEGFSSSFGKAIDTVFLPDAGTYQIGLLAYGRGGVSHQTTQQVVVASSDPVAGNMVTGGKMQPGDESKWLPLTYSDGVSFAIRDGKMVATGGNWGHAGIYQPVEVVAGKKYKVDMIVSGSGATDTWFEVYVGKAVPESGGGKDYNDGGIRLALNTWNGCGNAAFNGKLSAISCGGSGGTVSFPESGTVYLVIRTGGGNLGNTGIAITNVELRGTN